MLEGVAKQQDGRQVARTDTAKNTAAPTSPDMRICDSPQCERTPLMLMRNSAQVNFTTSQELKRNTIGFHPSSRSTQR